MFYFIFLIMREYLRNFVNYLKIIFTGEDALDGHELNISRHFISGLF